MEICFTLTWAWLLVALAIICLGFSILPARVMWKRQKRDFHSLAMEPPAGFLVCALSAGIFLLVWAAVVAGWWR